MEIIIKKLTIQGSFWTFQKALCFEREIQFKQILHQALLKSWAVLKAGCEGHHSANSPSFVFWMVFWHWEALNCNSFFRSWNRNRWFPFSYPFLFFCGFSSAALVRCFWFCFSTTKVSAISSACQYASAYCIAFLKGLGTFLIEHTVCHYPFQLRTAQQHLELLLWSVPPVSAFPI